MTCYFVLICRNDLFIYLRLTILHNVKFDFLYRMNTSKVIYLQKKYFMKLKYLLSFFILVTLFFSCNKEKRQAKKDNDIIEKYISSNHLNAIATGSGLYYVIDLQGTGTNPNASSQVTVAYKGYFTDGSVFDQSDAAGITFSLSGVIEGWVEGIPFFKKGGKGKLLIPSKLGYGPDGTSGIPGNSVLIFDITLLDVR